MRAPAPTPVPALDVPTLAVWGDEDSGTPAEGNQLIADLVPAAEHHVFAGARHVPMVEYPEQFSAIMLAWLSRQNQNQATTA